MFFLRVNPRCPPPRRRSYPSEDDDVVTSPYNSVLAMHQLTEFADCVLPVENQALADLVTRSSPVRPATLVPSL